MVAGSMEIVHEGMLKKSPPPKPLFRAKWRLRWFVLRSGELPGQYFLEYYTDQTRRKLKGRIDLDQCDQVDAGITFANRKSESDFKYMFDIKTPKRVYYLCAETEQEMNRWVDCVCHVCGLKIYSQEDEYPPLPPEHLSPTPPSATPPASLHSLPSAPSIDHPALDSPPLSPSSPGSSISGPYIPISTCFTGKRTPNTNTNFPFGDDVPLIRAMDNHRSSIPIEMAPPPPVMGHDSQPPLTQAPPPPTINTGAIPRDAFDSHRVLRPSGTTPEDALSVQSPLGTEGSSGFSEDEWVATPMKVEAKFFGEGRSLGNLQVRDIYSKEGTGRLSPGTGNGVIAMAGEVRGLTLADEDHQMLMAPPRPPKPPHLTEIQQQTYQNIESFTRATVVRRNSSNDKVRNGHGGPVTAQESASVPSDPEPSPMSVSSSLPPSTPHEVSEESHMVLKPQQFAESVSPQAAERKQKQQHCYNNFVVTPLQGQIFSYDVRHHDKPGELDPRISPVALYSNIPQSSKSPVHPPAVDRGLKPKKIYDCGNPSPTDIPVSSPPSSVGPQEVLGAVGGSPAPPASAPPIVDRNLKPTKNAPEAPVTKNLFVLEPAPVRNKKHNQKKPRAAPSPTPPSVHNGRGTNESGDEPDPSTPGSRRDSTNADEQIFFSSQSTTNLDKEIQYLDLDLEQDSRQSPKSLKGMSGVKGALAAASAPSVVYKKVDFVKTDAFNKMRVTVEDTYRKNQ